MRLAAAAVLTAVLSVLGVLGVLGGAAPAAAHAALTSSSPERDAVVATAPEEVTLTFSEQVAMSDDAIRVLDPDGERVDTGGIKDLSNDSSRTYGTALRTGLPDGTFTVTWQAVSADSHPISGAFTFSVGVPSETTAALPGRTAGGGTVGALYHIARYAAYTGFILLIGGSAFVLGCWHRGAEVRPVQRLVVTGWATLVTATLALLLLLRHPYTSTGALTDAFDLTGLKSALDTKPGGALAARLLLLATAALFISVLFGALPRRRDGREQRDLVLGLAVGGTVVAAGLGATWAMAEHASSGIQTGIAMPVDVIHLLAVAAWLGGLTALLATLCWGPPIPRPAVHRFSRLAFISVLVLVATGLYQSWRQVGSLPALTSTDYGQLLIAKLGLVALLVGLARISRNWTARLGEARETPPADPAPDAAPAPDSHSDPTDPRRTAQLHRQRAAMATARRKQTRNADPERSRLRRSVLAEAGVAVVLLAVTTALTATEPARTEEAAARATAPGTADSAPTGPVSITIPFNTGGPAKTSGGTAKISLDPGRSGDNTLSVRTDVDAAELKVTFTLPAKEIGPFPVTPDPDPDTKQNRRWTATDVQLPVPGEWKIALTVRTSDIDQVTETKNVKIG